VKPALAPSGADKITSDKRRGRESIRVTVSISLDTLNVDSNDILLIENGGMTMVSLQNAKEGGRYRVTWLLGTYAGYLHDTWDLCIDDCLSVLANNGSSLIIRFNGRKVAMSSDIAGCVKMEPV
jgi:hypothetical protein